MSAFQTSDESLTGLAKCITARVTTSRWARNVGQQYVDQLHAYGSSEKFIEIHGCAVPFGKLMGINFFSNCKNRNILIENHFNIQFVSFQKNSNSTAPKTEAFGRRHRSIGQPTGCREKYARLRLWYNYGLEI